MNVRVKLHSTFGGKLKRAREIAGITQKQLADKINESLATVQNWEQDYVIPRINTIIDLGKILDCDLDFLLGDQNEPRKEYAHISEMTGLSYDAASCLNDMVKDKKDKEWNEYILNVLSYLICHIYDGGLLPDITNMIYLDFSPDRPEDRFKMQAYYKSELMDLYGVLVDFIQKFRKDIGNENP